VAGAGGFDLRCAGDVQRYLDGAKLVRPQTTGTFVAVGDWSDVQAREGAALAQADQGAIMFRRLRGRAPLRQIPGPPPNAMAWPRLQRKHVQLSPSWSPRYKNWNLDKVFAQMVADVAAAGPIDPLFPVGMARAGWLW